MFITLSGENAGRALTEDAVNAMLRRLQEKTQIKVTSHMLRHYFANERRKNGWSLELISQALGHKNLQTTINYLNISNEELVEASEELFRKMQHYIWQRNCYRSGWNMAMAAISCFQEEKKNIEYLERQIEECPAREERFIKRGVEYLCLQNIYDVLEIEDGLVDSYMLWLQGQGIQDKHLIGAYQKTLRDWRGNFIRRKSL